MTWGLSMVEETGERGLKHHCCSKKMICDAYLMTMSFFTKAQSSGTIILSRNNVPSNSYSYGVVRVYYNGWGNICDDYYYNSAEANVICHQLGYTGASSYSRAGLVRCVVH